MTFDPQELIVTGQQNTVLIKGCWFNNRCQLLVSSPSAISLAVNLVAEYTSKICTKKRWGHELSITTFVTDLLKYQLCQYLLHTLSCCSYPQTPPSMVIIDIFSCYWGWIVEYCLCAKVKTRCQINNFCAVIHCNLLSKETLSTWIVMRYYS